MKICPMCGASYEDASVFCPVDGAALRSLADGNDLIHTVIADRYLITRKLGEGGMGRVYLAKHVRLPQSWAIKILDPALVRDAGSLARFNQEAASASRIENRHVARVIDFGETGDGLLYLVMEYVDGEPLSKIIEHEGQLDPTRASEIASQVAEALTAAHELGIVHRDLKPDNIMVGRGRGGTDEVKVVDFGIAKAIHDEREKVTKTGFVIGTPEYMSPEQISAGEVDGRSDVYALALVTFRMLTGRLPFQADTPQEAMLKRVTHPPLTLTDVFPDPAWPGEVQAVLDRALARDPDDRFPGAADFAQALRSAVSSWRSGASAGRADEGAGTGTAGEIAGGRTAESAGETARIVTPPSERAGTTVPGGVGATSRAATQAAPATPAAPAATTPAQRGRSATPPPATRAARRSPVLVRTVGALSLVAALGIGGYFALGPGSASSVRTDTLAADPDPGGAGTQAGTAIGAMGDSTGTGAPGDSAGTQLAAGGDAAVTPQEGGSTERTPSTSTPSSSRPAPEQTASGPGGGDAGSSARTRTPPVQPTESGRDARPDGSGGASGAASDNSGYAGNTESAAIRARRELDRLEAIIEVLDESNARRLLAAIPDALPRLATRADTVEAWYYMLQADILLNDFPAACGVMERIGNDGKSAPFAAALQVFSDSLPCR